MPIDMVMWTIVGFGIGGAGLFLLWMIPRKH